MICSKLYNEYDGIEHDYTRKRGLVHQEVLLTPQAPAEWTGREKLWNAVEEIEKTRYNRQNLYPQDSKDYGANFSNLIVYRYNQNQTENVIQQCDEWLDDVKPDYQKYICLKKEPSPGSVFCVTLRQSKNTHQN